MSSVQRASLVESSVPTADVDFFFDPTCPFAWLTSRWIRRVAELTGIDVRWRLISLHLINAARADSARDASHVRSHMASHRYLRVLAAVRAASGEAPVGDLYTAWGEQLWYREPQVGDFAELLESIDIAALLSSVGTDPGFAEAANDESWDAELAAETDIAVAAVGDDIGTPVLLFQPGGRGFFGPVISSVPDDETAVRMYDAVRTLVDLETFSEIKRTSRPKLDLPVLG